MSARPAPSGRAWTRCAPAAVATQSRPARRTSTGGRADRPSVETPARPGEWRQAVAAQAARRWTVRSAVAPQAARRWADRSAMAAQALRRSRRPTVAAKAGRPAERGVMETEATWRLDRTGRRGRSRPAIEAKKRGGPKARGPSDRPWRPKPPGDRGDKPWRPKPPGHRPTGRGGPSRLATAATSPGGPNRRRTVAVSRGGPRRMRTGGKPWRPKPEGRVGDKPSRPKPEGGSSRPPREKDDQGPPNDRSPREERGRKGGTRLVKKVRR